MAAFLSILMILVSFSVHAASYSTKDNDEDCPVKLNFEPEADLHYQPNTDKEGWAIESVDTQPNPLGEQNFETFPIGLNIPVAPFAPGVDQADPRLNLSETQVGIGVFEVDKGGALRFNGKPVQQQDFSLNPDCE